MLLEIGQEHHQVFNLPCESGTQGLTSFKEQCGAILVIWQLITFVGQNSWLLRFAASCCAAWAACWAAACWAAAAASLCCSWRAATSCPIEWQGCFGPPWPVVSMWAWWLLYSVLGTGLGERWGGVFRSTGRAKGGEADFWGKPPCEKTIR